MSRASQAFFVSFAILFAAACTPPAPVGASDEALTFRAPIDQAPGVLLVGHSADARRIAYVTPCDAGGGLGAELRLWDEWTGTLAVLARDVQCFPNLVHFSPDGELAAFGIAGQIEVYRPSTGELATVTQTGQGIGVDFSPDSSWLVVASRGLGPTASLEAWDADLQHHRKIADGAFYSPFAAGGPFANIAFSPGSTQLLYLGQLAPGFPVGALTLWSRPSGKTRVIATGVPATGYVVDGSWTRVAYLRDATPPMGPPFALPGTLAVGRLAGGSEKVIGPTGSGLPLAFADDDGTVLYTDDAVAGSASLKAFVIATATSYLVDTGVFSNLGRPTVTISPRGDAVAYLTAWNPMIGGGELRLATVPDGPGTPAPKVVGANVVLGSYGFADGGGALAYLHDPNATFPGAAIATLSAFDVDQATTTAIATQVPQQSLRIDAAREEVLYLDAYDAGRAAGDLQSWNARTGRVRLVGRRAAVMSIAFSPSGASVGFLQLAKHSAPGVPPAVNLALARTSGIGSAEKVDDDVSSFVLGQAGRVVYATPTGLWGAFVF